MPAAALLGSRGSALVNSSHGTLPWGPSVCSCRLQTRPRRPRQQHVARASDSPAAPAAPAPPPSSKRPALKQLVKQAWQLLQADALLLRRHLWAVLVVYSLKDVASFVLHRISHKLTNTGALIPARPHVAPAALPTLHSGIWHAPAQAHLLANSSVYRHCDIQGAVTALVQPTMHKVSCIPPPLPP
jgi:hypothetical protein